MADYGRSETHPIHALFRMVGGFNVASLSGNVSLTLKSSNFQRLDPNGSSRDVTLPVAGPMAKGAFFWITNTADAVESLVVKNPAGATIKSLPRQATVLVACDGSSWVVVLEVGDFGVGGLRTDAILESTNNAGVTIDGLLIKDGDLNLIDNDRVVFGTDADAIVRWDGTDIDVLALADDQVWKWGNGTNSWDQWWYGNTASDYILWDASAGTLSFEGAAAIGKHNKTIGASTAAAGTTTADAGVLPAATAAVYPTTAADGTKGVRIHANDKVTGREIKIGNGVSNQILKVYPPSGGTINGAAADAAFSTASGKGAIVVCLDSAANTWLAW